MTAPQQPASSSRPFAAAPDVSRYFPSTAMEEARQRVVRSVTRGEGPVLVIAAAGLGKTLLLDVVAAQFDGQLQSVTLMGGQLCTRRALLQMILFQLELPYREMDESELRLSLIAHLQPQGGQPRRILLLVDEADSVPPRLLEELRALTNLAVGGQTQVNLVLAGNSTLEEQFADPKLELFSQRVSARCYLSAFGREETFQFVKAQVEAAGHESQTLFTDEGLEAIFAATDGVPRLINQLGDQLMWMYAETGYAPLDELIVQQAWSELQQLPAPWNTQPQETDSGEVEFGELGSGDSIVDEIVFADDCYSGDSFSDDYDDDLPASIPINGSPKFADAEPKALENPTGAETLDVTADLLQQLDELDQENQTPQLTLDSGNAVNNPFSEPFESEEIVLDRYSSFESLLLAEAPRVANRADTAFSQQLQQFETFEAQASRPKMGPLDKLAESEPFCITAEAYTPASFSTLKEPSPIADSPPVTSPADASTDHHAPLDFEEPGEILVIEESEPAENTVVSGQKFRQLFSSLESSAGTPRFG